MPRLALAVGCAFGIASSADAQQKSPVRIGIAAIGVGSDPVFAGLGPTAGWRLGSQVDLAGFGFLGKRGDVTVLRGEVGARAYATRPIPGRRSWYVVGGLAGVTGPTGSGYLLAALGIEGGRRTRWFAEAGVGGGVRLVVGVRRGTGDRGRG